MLQNRWTRRSGWVVLVGGGCLLRGGAAWGAVSDFDPASGQTVTVDTTAPNPDSGTIIADEGPITLRVLEGAQLTGGSQGVTLEFGSTIFVGGTITASNQAIEAFSSLGDHTLTVAGTLTVSSPTGEAVLLGGGDDTVELWAGYDITGAVNAYTGTDTLVLGGDDDASFNLSQIGNTNQYWNFENYRKTGDSTWTLTGSSDVDWSVDQGTLRVDGSINAAVTVDGGTLSGAGYVESLTVNAGGRLSPIGSSSPLAFFSVENDLNFNAGSTYVVQLDGSGSSDVIHGDGNIVLADGANIAVSVVANGDLIKEGDQWRILYTHAFGSTVNPTITDLGAQITDDFAGFDFVGDLRNAGLDYYLIAVSQDLEPAMSSPEGRRVARVLDTDRHAAAVSTDLQTFIDTVGSQSDAQAEATLLASDPRSVAASRATQNRTAQRFHAGVQSHLQNTRLGLPQITAAATDTTQALPGSRLASAAAADPRLLQAYFAQADPHADDHLRTDLAPPSASATGADREASAFGGFGSIYYVDDDLQANDNLTGSRSRTLVGQAGLDRQITPHARLGLSLSYAYGEHEFEDNQGRELGWADTDTLRVGPYASYDRGPWAVDASLTIGLHDNQQTRVNPGLTSGNTFTADYDSRDLAAYLGAGYDLPLRGPARGWVLTPRVSAQYVYTWSDGYTEAGGGGALSVQDTEADALRATFGLGLARLVQVGEVRLMPRVEVGYAHEFLDQDQTLQARFVGGASPFTVAAAGPARDSVYYAAGVTALLNHRTTLDLGYAGETANDQQTHALRLGLRLTF